MKTLSKSQIKTIKTNETKSKTIRYLDRLNYSRGEIVKLFKEHLDVTIRYQHVRNVLITPIKTER